MMDNYRKDVSFLDKHSKGNPSAIAHMRVAKRYRKLMKHHHKGAYLPKGDGQSKQTHGKLYKYADTAYKRHLLAASYHIHKDTRVGRRVNNAKMAGTKYVNMVNHFNSRHKFNYFDKGGKYPKQK